MLKLERIHDTSPEVYQAFDRHIQEMYAVRLKDFKRLMGARKLEAEYLKFTGETL